MKSVFRFSLQIWSETFPIVRRTVWDVIINAHWSSFEVKVILVRL
jgi:hypothetical protein